MSTLPIKLALESLEAQIGAKDVESFRHASPSELCMCLPLHSLTPKADQRNVDKPAAAAAKYAIKTN